MFNDSGWDRSILDQLEPIVIVDSDFNYSYEWHVFKESYKASHDWTLEDFKNNIVDIGNINMELTHVVPQFIWHRDSKVGPSFTKRFKGNIVEIQYREYDKLTRYDGPAFLQDHFSSAISERSKFASMQWYINNIRINEADYREWLLESGMDIDNLTINDKILIDMRWGTYD